MTRKHHTIYSDPTGAAAAAAPVKRRTTRTKSSALTSEISSKDSNSADGTEIDREAVARLAYSYWEARGFAGGSAEEDWLRAEQEIREGTIA